MRKYIVSVLSLIVLLTASMAQAADRNWTGGGADELWTTPENWDSGVPGPGDNGNINNGGTALIDSSVSASLSRVELCNGGSGGATLTMTGGSLSQSGQYPLTVGSKPGAGVGIFNLSGGDVFSGDGFLISNSGGSAGIVNMSGGSIDSQATYSPSGWWSIFGVGDAGVGTLNMSGGVITANVMKIPARSGSGTLNMTGGTIEVAGGLYVNGSGEVHLDDGVINAAELFMSGPGSMDIMAGVVILNGDDTSVIEGYINQGLITGYGDPANVRYDYNVSNPGHTTVWAVPPTDGVHWDGGGSDDLWTTADNWIGDTLPGAGDNAIIIGFFSSPVLVADGVTASAENIVVGQNSVQSALDVTGGSLTSTQFTVGDGGAVFLSGGLVRAGDLSMSSGSHLYITGGVMILDGNDVATVQGYVEQGLITGYGDSANVRYDYNISNAGQTTVRAVPRSVCFTSAAQTAVKFGVHEISLTGNGSVSNAFDTICTVTFTPPSGSANAKTVHAFYDGGDIWRARCYINETGSWSWSSYSADDALLDGKSGTFTAESSNLRGMLKPHWQNPQMWMTDNNKTFVNIADTAYRLFSPETWAKDYLNFVADDRDMGISTLRCMLLGAVGEGPILWNDYFENGGADKDRPNLSHFQHTDGRLKLLLNNYPDMYIQLILFPGGYLGGDAPFWSDNLTETQRNRLMRYIIARFAAFPNKFWEISNDNICHDQATHPKTWFWATNVGEYFKDNDPWGHFIAFGQKRDEVYPFCDEDWSTYIVGYTQYDLACELIEYRGYDRYPKHVYNTEDYYETYNPPAHPKYFYRRFMWSYLLSGASATYAQNWDDLQPYSQSVCGDRSCRGLDSIPFIRSFLAERNIDLALFTPDDDKAEQINAPGPEYNDGPSKPQCTRRGYEEFIVYIPNAAYGEKAGFGEGWSVTGEYTRRDAALDRGKTPQVRVDLRSAAENNVYVVQWYRVRTGVTVDASTVTGGSWRTFTSPWQGEDVVLYLSRISSDFNKDGEVNFKDFAVFASYWMKDDICSGPDWCQGSDLDLSGTVDLSDFITFTESWLVENSR